MRKTKTRTKRKTSRTTQKKRGGAESPPQYVIRTETLDGEKFHDTNITHDEYSNLTRRNDETLNAREIHQVVAKYSILREGIDVTKEMPSNLKHIIDGNRYIIVARYPRSFGTSPRRRGRSRSLARSSPRDRKRSLSRSSSSSLGSK